MALKKPKTAMGLRPIAEIMNSLQHGEAEPHEIIWLGQMIEEFKRHPSYEIIRIDIIQATQAILAKGRPDSAVKAEHVLGKLEGMQLKLEGIESMIMRGKMTLAQQKQQDEMEQQERETNINEP